MTGKVRGSQVPRPTCWFESQAGTLPRLEVIWTYTCARRIARALWQEGTIGFRCNRNYGWELEVTYKGQVIANLSQARDWDPIYQL